MARPRKQTIVELTPVPFQTRKGSKYQTKHKGVYKIKDMVTNKIMYIGSSQDIAKKFSVYKDRFSQELWKDCRPIFKWLLHTPNTLVGFEWEEVKTKEEMFELESKLIKEHNPPLNMSETGLGGRPRKQFIRQKVLEEFGYGGNH